MLIYALSYVNQVASSCARTSQQIRFGASLPLTGYFSYYVGDPFHTAWYVLSFTTVMEFYKVSLNSWALPLLPQEHRGPHTPVQKMRVLITATVACCG